MQNDLGARYVIVSHPTNRRDSFFSCTLGNRGYSGTATFVKTFRALPFASEDGFTGCNGLSTDAAERLMTPHEELVERYSVEELQELDAEGRVVVTDHGAFVLFNVYGPAITASDSEAAAARFKYKLRFYGALQARWDKLARRGRAVIVVGDLNICIAPADTCDLKVSGWWSWRRLAIIVNTTVNLPQKNAPFRLSFRWKGDPTVCGCVGLWGFLHQRSSLLLHLLPHSSMMHSAVFFLVGLSLTRCGPPPLPRGLTITGRESTSHLWQDYLCRVMRKARHAQTVPSTSPQQI